MSLISSFGNKKLLISICGTSGKNEAKNDICSICKNFPSLGYRTIVVIDSISQYRWIKQKHPNIESYNNISAVKEILKPYKHKPSNVIISISTYGYTESADYFCFGGRRVDSNILRNWYENFICSKSKIITIVNTFDYERYDKEGDLASIFLTSLCKMF